MNVVMNMVGKPFKTGEVIFDFGEKSDVLYLIHSGSVEIVPREGLALSKLKAGELFGEMASILADHLGAEMAAVSGRGLKAAS